MAISAYVGLPGSGKSYEVVASVIIPACISGRRIVSNIYGLSAERIYDYCVDVKKAKRDELGDIILVENDDVQDKDFFPYKTDAGIADTTRCRPGDLICIDEAWRIWESDRAIPANHRSFMAEHRHFTDAASGICCDLVVINQSVTNLPRFIKDRIETTYRMQKLLALGLKSRYRVDVFTGIKLFKSHKASSYQCGYDKAIFPLYRSYEAGNGKELTIDKRQNVLASSRLWWTVAGLLLLAGVSVSFLVRFFTHVQGSDPQVTSPAPSNAAVTMSPSVAVAVPPKPVMSSSWRVAGRLAKAGQVWVLLADNNGRLRAEPVSLFTFEGVMMTGVIDGERVTVWSGGVKG